MEEIAILDIINKVENQVPANFGRFPFAPYFAELPESSKQLAAYIDHTVLKPEATKEQIVELCEEAERYRFASVCVNPCWVATCKERLQDTDVKVCAVAGFPLGANDSIMKAHEAQKAAKDGADEIDMVINVGRLKMGDYLYVYKEIKELIDQSNPAEIKVILENCLLTPDEIVAGCVICKMAGVHFVKTSTGFSYSGASLDDIELMRRVVGHEMGVKAAGGIRDRETALEMIKSGATRIGASASVKIVTE
jgi:deoxyribose-phosphate aldolase